MIIPRHRICNFCGQEVGINKRYFIIKSKNIILDPSVGEFRDNIKADMCIDCMNEFKVYLRAKLRGKKND